MENFRPETIKRFFKDWYRPDLQALIIVGDVNVNEMEKEVKAQFSSLKNPAKEKLRTNYIVTLTRKNQFIEVTQKEMTSTVAEIVIKHAREPLKTATDYRNSIILSLINQMLADRYAD